MKTIILLIFLIPTFVFGQNSGTIKLRKPATEEPCINCISNKEFTGTSGLIITLNRTESFKKQTIECYKISIFQNGTLLSCYAARPDTINPILRIPAGKYKIVASADKTKREMFDVRIAENKTTYLTFEFGDANDKKRKARK